MKRLKLDGFVRDLELTIKSTEAGLVAKRNLLNELLLKQSESEKV